LKVVEAAGWPWQWRNDVVHERRRRKSTRKERKENGVVVDKVMILVARISGWALMVVGRADPRLLVSSSWSTLMWTQLFYA
jgi:hypothetical protein